MVSFTDQTNVVADALLGQTLVVGNREAVILKTEGFDRATNAQRGLYKPVLSMQPGEVYCPNNQGSVILLVVTLDGNQSGGCVLVRATEINGDLYDGPGKTTKALHLTTSGQKGRIEVISEEDVLLLHLGSAVTPRPQPKKKMKLPQGLSNTVLQKCMPDIVKHYMIKSRKQYRSFQLFLNALIESCSNESQLRARLQP